MRLEKEKPSIFFVISSIVFFFFGLAGNTYATNVRMSGRQILLDGKPFAVKGVGYSPVPIGVDPETTPPYGDYFTSNYSAIYERDLPLIREMGANTIRLLFWNNGNGHRDFLNKAYNDGIKPLYVIITFWMDPVLYPDISSPDAREKIKADFRALVTAYKTHPAILMWSIGDELNSPKMYGDKLGDLLSLINEMAHEAHKEEGAYYHPVTTPLADIDLINTIVTYEPLMPDLDIWGANIYRGSSFGTFFSDFKAISAKPLIILGFGIDAYDENAEAEYENIGIPYQAAYAESLWKEISANSGGCLGGIIRAYSDEWWLGKFGNTLGGCPDLDPAFHGPCGHPSSSDPDGFVNYEWFGIMRVNKNGSDVDIMEPRAGYFTLKQLWAPGGTTPSDNPTCPSTINFGQTIQCSVSAPGEADTYTFSASANDRVLVRASRTSGSLWPGIRLYGPDGAKLTEAGDTPTAEIPSFTLPTTGSYTILVYDSFNGTLTGNYNLSLICLTCPPPCSYSVFPANESFGAGGGAGSVNVTTQSGCAWSAVSNVGWVTITSGSSGSGNGTVNYSVSANASTNSRSGTMTIAGQTFTVNQSGTTCTYSISSPNQSFDSNGGAGSVNVTTQSGCAWSATSNAAWVTITSGSSGSGNGTVNYSVSANASTNSRSGTMTIAGQTFTVNQSGTTCTYSISSPNQSFDSNGGAGSVNVTTQSGCAWSATSNAAWVTITSGSSGSGNGTVNYSVSANISTNSRSGPMTIAGQTFAVTQAELLGITITSPNGGETWNTGTTQTIQWIYTGSPGLKVRIELLKGGVVNRVIKSSASIGKNGSGSYNWKIPSNQASGNDYEIRVTSTSNSSYTDTSNSSFSIHTPSTDNTVVGTWQATGTMRVTVSIRGYGSQTEVVNFQDEFTFYPNGNFEMIDFSGTWSQTKNKVTVNLGLEDVALYFEDYLGEYGLDVSVDATKATLTGTLQKNGTLKGPLAFNMSIYFYDLDTDGKVKVSGSFTGTRMGEVSSLQEGDSALPLSTPVDVIIKQIFNTIKDLNVTKPQR